MRYNNYYEKIGTEVRNITDEIPFEIPDSWEWVRVKDIAEVYTGNSIAESIKRAKYMNLTEGYNYIGTKDVGFDNVIDYENGVKIPKFEPKFRYAFPYDILLCIEGGSAGRKIGILREQVCFGNKLCNFHQYFNSSSYMYYFLQTPSFVSIFKENMTGIIGGVSRDKIQNILFPLPPLEEQKRIVSKIESLEPFIDDYNQAETELSKLNDSFPKQIKKSILQYAIQGKLVPQDPNDEPASILLEKIKAEKQKLIKAGKIKKDKVESYIYKRDNRHYEKIDDKEVDITDEIPFEIPNSWVWVRLGIVSFVTKLAGFEYTKYIANNLVSEGIPLFKGKNIQDGKIVYSFESYISKETSDFLIRSQINKKCILTPYVGTIGNIAIHNREGRFHLGSNVGKIELFNNFSQNLLEEYVLFYLKSDFGYKELTKHKKATAQESISIDAIRDVLIPIPPIREQESIVSKVEEILKLLLQGC